MKRIDLFVFKLTLKRNILNIKTIIRIADEKKNMSEIGTKFIFELVFILYFSFSIYNRETNEMVEK